MNAERPMRRRDFVLSGSALFAASLRAPALLGQSRPRVVVIGGGAGGATAARYLAKDSNGALDVVLVEPADSYTTCFHSNLYLGGFRNYQSITHSYARIAALGVRHVHQLAAAIDRDRREVRLADGAVVGYDRLIVAPGIDLDYDSVPGWGRQHERVMPHAWKPGAQTQLLKARLDAVPDGGVIVILPPPNPYRCPPGPYERASMMAHILKATGRTRAKIFILDPKESFSKQALFQEGWEKYYPGQIEWLGPKVHDGLKRIDVATSTVETGFEIYRNCALVNVIPAQTASAVVRNAGLTNQTGYCPILPETMKSAMDANIHILGDAAIAGDMPKSAFAANSQAKVAAMAVRGELTGSRQFAARYANTCWSLIETDDAVKVGGRYEAKDGAIRASETFISHTEENADLRRQNQAENMDWYAGIAADIFG
jgi:NADPH-dependent 2,4-dienoyl-CoA reductase/sulfur reductase-like enzyme